MITADDAAAVWDAFRPQIPSANAASLEEAIVLFAGSRDRSGQNTYTPPVVRASEMGKVCTRWVALRQTEAYKGKEVEWEGKMLDIFDIGKLVEEHYRDAILGPMGILYGKWLCRRCGNTHKGKMPTECGSVLTIKLPKTAKGVSAEVSTICPGDWTYEETRVVEPETGVPGGPDGFLRLSKVVAILELKSEDDEKFKILTCPYESHLNQAHIYMKATKIWIVVFIYVSKSSGKRKIYVARFDERHFAGLKSLNNHYVAATKIEDPMAISRPSSCNKPTQAMAGRCPARFVCHPTHKWSVK